jgi:hypothetical protein
VRSFDLLCDCPAKPDLRRALASCGRRRLARLLQLAATPRFGPISSRLSATLIGRPPDAKQPSTRSAFAPDARLFLTDNSAASPMPSREGLPFATFKGIALAALHHGNQSLREFDDIDLIVPQPRLAEAERLLRSLGYGSADGEEAFRGAFFAYQRQYAFVRTSPDVSVDLHWAFTSAHLPFPLDPAEIWTDLAVSINHAIRHFRVQISRCCWRNMGRRR